MTAPAPASVDVAVQNLTVTYGDVTALDDLSLDLPGGRIYGLLGRNGSGKTTLLASMSGFRRPPSGTVRVGGVQPWDNASALADICLLGDNGPAIDGDTVRGVLRRAALYRPRWDTALADKLIETFGISRKQAVAKLSRGQRSALNITVAVAGRTALTLLDEAYLGMDAPSRYAFYDLLLEDYIENPRTIIVSTHHIDEVAPLFEAVMILDEGRLIAYDDTEALRTRGMAVTGPAEAVSRFTDGMTVLSEQRLGPTVSITVLGSLDETRRRAGLASGLELSPVTLQDLFVHLTSGGVR